MKEFSFLDLSAVSLNECLKAYAAIVDTITDLSEKEAEYSALVVHVQDAVVREGILKPSSNVFELEMLRQYGEDIVAQHKKRWYHLIALREQAAFMKYLLEQKKPVATSVTITPVD